MYCGSTRSVCTVMRRDCACNLALYCAPVRSVDCPKEATLHCLRGTWRYMLWVRLTRLDDAFWLALLNGAKRSMALRPQV